MLHKTRGIVLHYFPYNDKYKIAHIYTEAFGKASFMAAVRRGKSSQVGKALFMPLSIHEMEVESFNNRDLWRIREAKLCAPLHRLSTAPVKSVIALFLSEFIFRVLKEAEPDPRLFEFLSRSISLLEETSEGVANFHLAFLIRLSPCLGLSPQAGTYRAGSLFNMLDGAFTLAPPTVRAHDLSQEDSRFLDSLLRMSYENMALYSFTRRERVLILNKILDYYRLHLPYLPELKSLPILQALFD